MGALRPTTRATRNSTSTSADTVERASAGPAARDTAAGPLPDHRSGNRHLRRRAADRAADGLADPRYAARTHRRHTDSGEHWRRGRRPCAFGLGALFRARDRQPLPAFTDPRASGWTGGFQGGVDLWRGAILPGHRDAAGVYVAFANSSIAVDGLVTNAAATGYTQVRTGTLGLNAYSVGGYWTHYGPGGWYLDALVQGTYYNGNAMTQFASLPINGAGFATSLEGGYPIPLPLGPRFVLEPQAQIIWQQVTFQDSNDGLGPVGLGSTSGATGRVGVRGLWTIVSDNGQVWQPYARANLWRDWDAGAATTIGID